MKRFLVLLAVVVFSLTLAAPAFAMDGEMDCPGDMAPTIESLHHCVEHAVTMGHVDAGVGQSLLAKLGAANAAALRGQAGVATALLKAFISEVEAQAGLHIDPKHAEHIMNHAQMVVDAL